MRDEEIKGLLDRAFGPEPPLTLDRDAIFERGRRSVRLRRMAASGGVAASVVAVVVGAAVITGVAGRGTDEVAGPAYGTTTPSVTTTSGGAPAGPKLPLTANPSGGEDPTTDVHAAALTKALAAFPMISVQFTPVAVVDDGREPLAFRHSNGFYRLTADLRDAKGVGSLDLVINYARADVPALSCASAVVPEEITCDELQESNVRMRVSTERRDPGYLSNTVYALRPDGTVVYVTSSNLSGRGAAGKPSSRPAPPLDAKTLRVIATLPGLTFY